MELNFNKGLSNIIQKLLNSVFTLSSERHGVRPDANPNNVYLYKNGQMCICTNLSKSGMDWNTKQYGMLNIHCGSFCQHFHLVQDMRKVLVPESEGSEKKVEKIVKTGRLRVNITCGSGSTYLIDGVKLDESPADNSNENNLKVVKSAADPQ